MPPLEELELLELEEELELLEELVVEPEEDELDEELELLELEEELELLEDEEDDELEELLVTDPHTAPLTVGVSTAPPLRLPTKPNSTDWLGLMVLFQPRGVAV